MLADKEVLDIRKAVFDLIGKSDFEQAGRLIDVLLEHDPEDAAALNFLGVIHLELHNFHLAYQFFRRALSEQPEMAPIWVNFGLAAHELGRNKEAINAYLKASQLDQNYVKAYANAAAVLIEEAKWDDAETSCKIGLDIAPDDSLTKKNLAHVYLARHEWTLGWKHWELSLGCKYRKEWQYGDEKRWGGEKKAAVIIYGEQGLGDEICYASCVPDAIKDCRKVIIDCDPKLEKLFKRSFPRADVHGTRTDAHPAWLEDARFEYRCAISSLASFYRNSDADFPGTPYLIADPELVTMWKGLFATWGKPVYGLCLHGGSKLTGASWRKLEPEDFSPLFALNAEFVSLDYKGHLKHPKIHEFQWATQCSEYDLTASLIAALDAVIGVNTTAIHCANALGVKTHILVPIKKQWRYEPAPDGSYVWSKTATLYQQKEGDTWRDVVRRVRL